MHLAGSFSKERSSFRNGGLGPSCDSGGAVCAVESGAAVPAAGARARGGVWEYADQRAFHFGPHHYLLRPHHHLPHRHRSSHLHRLIWFPFSDASTTSPAPFFVASLPCSPLFSYKTVTSSHCFTDICTIEANLNAFINSKDVNMNTMAYEMKKKFDKYWEGLEINKLLIVSSVLDPRSKMSFVTICFERLYGKDTPKCMEMKEAIVEVLRKLYEVYIALHAKPSGGTNQSVGGSGCQSCQTTESVLDVGVTIGDVVPIPNLFTTYSNMVREKGNVEETSNELDIYLMEKIEMPTPNRLGM
nr:zinc finger BED domain-containing protein RICESLEEPER 2-like [Ipomoea batatas]